MRVTGLDEPTRNCPRRPARRGEPAIARQTARELRLYPDEDGCIVIRARLPAEAGAVVLEALEAAMAAQRAGENRFAQRRADALATMVETTLRHGGEALSSAERHRAVVHVTAETLAGKVDGRSELEGGRRLAPETARRIACNGS